MAGSGGKRHKKGQRQTVKELCCPILCKLPKDQSMMLNDRWESKMHNYDTINIKPFFWPEIVVNNVLKIRHECVFPKRSNNRK